MLFNSHIFLLAFLPACLAGHAILQRISNRAASIWLLAASITFYSWGSTSSHIALLVASIGVNYVAGAALAEAGNHRRSILVAALAFNLGGLAYFKYAGFLAGLFGLHNVQSPELPLGISFFTFTQIAFLVDSYRRSTTENSPINYALFVAYFPHLIAGPILNHREMQPQFKRGPFTSQYSARISIGLSIFILGLAKKLLLADAIAPYADAICSRAGYEPLTMMEAWTGALSYTLQIYFDFSAYCDMAVGVSYMLGIRIPMNFNSPYKATSIIDFWRRWHMSLSRFLRDYLYIPLGGNRFGAFRRYRNLMLTMLIGGLWHGAGWTFIIWGGLHGVYLTANHLWRSAGWFHIPQPIARLLTLLAVVAAWVFFRAESVPAALSMLHAMFGGAGLALPERLQPLLGDSLLAPWIEFGMFRNKYVVAHEAWITIAALGSIALFCPNTLQFFARFWPTLDPVQPASVALLWRPSLWWNTACGCLLVLSVLLLSRESPFLYFRF
jgi:alginate O-acetyltransferase complex protein AlgI